MLSCQRCFDDEAAVGILLLLCDVVYAGSDNLPALFTVKLYSWFCVVGKTRWIDSDGLDIALCRGLDSKTETSTNQQNSSPTYHTSSPVAPAASLSCYWKCSSIRLDSIPYHQTNSSFELHSVGVPCVNLPCPALRLVRTILRI